MLLLWVPVLPAHAQLSAEAQVSLITVYPGEAIYALWGHSALRIADPVQGLDVVYNFGTFDYGHMASFVARFAYGKLEYHLSLQRYASLVHHSWTVERRPVVEQVLRLTPQQVNELYGMLSLNARAENRSYRYEFLRDNCATRIRDVLERVLGYSLASDQASTDTFRELLDTYVQHQAPLQLGINLGMGRPADQTATMRERMFLPLEMERLIGETVSPEGEKLVVARTQLRGQSMVPLPGPRLSWPAGIAWALALAVIAGSVRDLRTRRRRRLDYVAFVGTGIVGVVLGFLAWVSVHEVTSPNINLLWAWPSHIVMVFVRARWTRYYWWAAAAGSLICVAGIPIWTQAIPQAGIALALVVAARAAIWAQVPRTGFEPVLPA